METNRRVKLTIGIVSGAWSFALLVAGLKLPGLEVKILGFLPSLIVAGFALFDSWAWRTKPVQKLVSRPNLNGTWTGTFTSIRDSDGTGARAHDPVAMFLVIRQTYISLKVSLISKEGSSYSFSEDLQRRIGDQFVAYYHYTSTPDLLVRDRSPEHDGGTKLSISGRFPQAITGEYWTNRGSRGTISVERLSGKQVGTWSEALELESKEKC